MQTLVARCRSSFFFSSALCTHQAHQVTCTLIPNRRPVPQGPPLGSPEQVEVVGVAPSNETLLRAVALQVSFICCLYDKFV